MTSSSNFILRLLAFLDRPRRIQMGISVLFGLAFAATTLVPPLLIRRLILWLTEGGGTQRALIGVVLALLGVYIVRGACRYFYGNFSHIVAYHTLDDLMTAVYRHLQGLSHRFYNSQRTGALLSRSINDIEAVEDFIAHGIPDLVLAVVIPATMIGVLLTIDPLLTLIVVLPLPIAGFIIYRFTRQIRVAWRRVRSGLSELVAQVQDSFAGITEIKSFGREREQAERIARNSAEFRDASVAANRISLLPAGIVEFTGGLGTVLAVGVGGLLALDGRLTVADLYVFVAYLSHIYQPFLKLADIGDILHKAASSCERVFELLDVQPDIVSPPDGLRPRPMTWDIEFCDVSFAYQSANGSDDGNGTGDENSQGTGAESVLHHVSFRVEEGEMVALVGATGAGKTTVSRLIPRFYDPQAGAVRIGGHDVRKLDLEYLREHVAAVLQDVFLFHGTVRQNILFGRMNASHAEVQAAAKAANAHQFIMELPQGYDTLVGERGVRLSGGQKQRISIARALLKDAPILILDEATSSVDVETEAQIQQAFTRLAQHRTTLVIAHRLSTIRHADKIIVLHDGRIVEMGSHEALLAENGRYARMVRAQDAATHWELSRTQENAHKNESAHPNGAGLAHARG